MINVGINSIINTDKDYNYLVDPHTAIGLCGVESFTPLDILNADF